MRSRHRRWRSKGIGDASPTSNLRRSIQRGNQVQVYTACQFVTPIICGQNYSQVGNKKLIHLHLNWVEVSNLTSAQLEQKLIRTCSQLGHKLYVGRKLANRAKLQHFAHFRIFSFASICKMTCQGKLPDTL